MKNLVGIFLYLISSYFFPVYAQCNLTLKGYILDEHDHTPLIGASIYINELKKGVFTDTTGYFEIKKNCLSTYTIHCSHIGCESIEKKITTQKDSIYTFYLEHHTYELNQVAIIGEKKIKEYTLGSETISGKNLSQVNGLSLGELLKKIIGINTIQTGSTISKPIINGMYGNRISILLNEVRQEGQQWGIEHAPEIDAFLAQSITVIKGAKAIQYGPTPIGGTILVEPESLSPITKGEINMIGMSNGRQGITSGFFQTSLKKIPALRWRIQGTYKKGGNIKTPAYFLKNTGHKEYDFSTSLVWVKPKWEIEFFYNQFNTTMGLFSGSHVGNLTDLENAFQQKEPLEKSGFNYTIDRPFQKVEHELLKLKAKFNLCTNHLFQFIYSRQFNQRSEYDKHTSLYDSIAALNLPELNLKITTHAFDINWEHQLTPTIEGKIGINTSYQENTYRGFFFIPNFKNKQIGFFGYEHWEKDKIQIEAGIRYDYQQLQIYMYNNNRLISPIHYFHTYSSTINFSYLVNKNITLIANVSTAQRPPSINELYSNGLHNSAASIEIGNNQLQPEKSYQASASIEWNSKKIHFQSTFYINQIHNYIYTQPTSPTLSIRGAFPTFLFEQVNAQLKGINTSISYNIHSSIQLGTQTSIIRGFNQDIHNYLIYLPSDRYELYIQFEKEKINKIHHPYFRLQWMYVAKQIRVPANTDFVSPPSDYSLIGLETGIDFYIHKQKIETSISVSNLLNIRYREYLNRFRYYADEMGRNISIRIKIPFELNANSKNYE